jgi:hypothetical protein
MKRLMLCVLLAFAPLAWGQVCDVTYSWESETMDGQDVGNGSATFFAQPMSEVEFNHKAQIKVLNAMAKEQDAKKDGIYRTDVSEYRVCDGGAKVKIEDGSASIQGVSYAGANRIMDEAIRQMRVINDHHKERVAKGHKSAWDHGKAKKVKRNDLHQKIKD